MMEVILPHKLSNWDDDQCASICGEILQLVFSEYEMKHEKIPNLKKNDFFSFWMERRKLK